MALDLRTGRTVWQTTQSSRKKHPKLKNNISTDILVVSGGITGTLLAHRLSDMGREVTIIDRHEIGAGSTSASTAILSYEADVNLRELIQMIGERSAVRAYRAGIEGIDSIGERIQTLDDSCEFRKRRSLYLASSLDDVSLLKREYQTRRRNGFRVEFPERRELAKSFALVAPCAILNEDAAEVDPLRLTLTLLRSAERKGLRAYADTKLVTFRRHGNYCSARTEGDFQIHARHVVFATGYESQQILKQTEVRLVSSYAIATGPLIKFPEGRERPVIWESARPYLYVRTATDSYVVTLATREGRRSKCKIEIDRTL